MQLPTILVDDAERRIFFVATHIVIGGLIVAACFPASRIVANLHRGFAIYAQALDCFIWLRIFCLQVGEDGVGFWNFFWGLALTTLRRR